MEIFTYTETSPQTPWDLSLSGSHDLQVGGVASQPCQPRSPRSGRLPAFAVSSAQAAPVNTPRCRKQNFISQTCCRTTARHGYIYPCPGQIRWPVLKWPP